MSSLKIFFRRITAWIKGLNCMHLCDLRVFLFIFEYWRKCLFLMCVYLQWQLLVYFCQKLLASLMRNYFPKRTSGALLHTLSKLYDVHVSFVSFLFWGSVMLDLRSPKGGCCSISDELSCSFLYQIVYHFKWIFVFISFWLLWHVRVIECGLA